MNAARAAEPAVTIPAPAVDAATAGTGPQTIVLAGGCFWGVQAVFQHTKGVTGAVSGYAGGNKQTANYDMVGSGSTGHAESVAVTFDPQQISYGKILQIYFSVAHNPTELNRQGPDVGTQYRSAIFYADDEQKRIAESYVA
ncbi:MAG TPA: peptide-methionine (S)-S-oxide reductase MsrA, partial [Xanthobacteraceae bacterium]|nr:peptide-methionine (S)-S-oxide reductase MsrA [Xanthobacteraceae bacterium]